MTYDALVRALFEQNQFAIKYDLDAMREAVRRLGLPRPANRVILVGGTNGKGSTCARLNALAVETGLRVGLYTSPHLVEFRERIRIDGVPIDRDSVVRFGEPLFARFSGRRAPSEAQRPLSYFELVTLMAWQAFSASDLDLAIFEVGLGGRLDATNTIDPDLSILTSVSLDHQAYLGDTLEEIASEKAAIARPGRPVVIHEHAGGAEALAAALDGRGALIRCSGGSSPSDWNRALAERAFDTLYPGRASDEDRARAAQRARWPGRQQVWRSDARDLLLDGAHNDASAAACAAWVRTELEARGSEPVPVVLAVSGGRDPVMLARHLDPVASHYIATAASSAPCTPATEVAARLEETGRRAVVAPTPADALALCGRGTALVTGSLYLIGDTLAELGCDADDLRIC